MMALNRKKKTVILGAAVLNTLRLAKQAQQTAKRKKANRE